MLAPLLVLTTSPALAHTRLVESMPANRSITTLAPEHLTLVFAEPVDPRSVHLDVVTIDGTVVTGMVLLTPTGADRSVIEYALPDLADGVYGLAWVTVGPDGHRVAGEVVIGVGRFDEAAVGEAEFQTTSPLDRMLGVFAAVGRMGWYVGIAVLYGALAIRWWALRRDVSSSAAGTLISERGYRALWAGALVLHVGLLLRTVSTVALVARGYRDASPGEALRLALIDNMGLTLVVATVGSLTIVLVLERWSQRTPTRGIAEMAVSTLLVVALGSTTSHTSVFSEDPFGIWVSTLHLAAAGMWAGPLIVITSVVLSSPWRSLPAQERAKALNDVFSRFAPLLVASFVVLVATGVRSAWLLAGTEILSGSDYTVTLIVKVALLVAVIVPLGIYHDRQAGILSRRRASRHDKALKSTLGIESFGFITLLAAGTILATLNPVTSDATNNATARPAEAPTPPAVEPATQPRNGDGPELAAGMTAALRGRGMAPPPDTATDRPDGPGQASPTRQVTTGPQARPTMPSLSEPAPTPPPEVDDPDTSAPVAAPTDPPEGLMSLFSDMAPSDLGVCSQRTIGKANCYRDYFATVMRTHGADVAVAEIAALEDNDPFIALDCHRIVHDLGNDAAEWYGDIGLALSFEGSPCWSGYYHGVVEYVISQFEGSDLYQEMPYICVSASARRYSFTHYNCVHGLGHGVMLNVGGDLFEALPYCEALTDEWELSSCVGGAIMENISTAQQGGPLVALSTDDLIYPCNVIDDDYVDECFAMQTSWMLSQLGYAEESFLTAFALCGTVREDMVDDCYRSMGRDISALSRLTSEGVVYYCSLGDVALQSECYVGAALNAVYNDHDTVDATRLCAAIPTSMQQACLDARDAAAATL